MNKIQKQLKDSLLKDLPPIKLKQLSVIPMLNHINISVDHTKIYMILLIYKKHADQLFQLLITRGRFRFTALFVVI